MNWRLELFTNSSVLAVMPAMLVKPTDTLQQESMSICIRNPSHLAFLNTLRQMLSAEKHVTTHVSRLLILIAPPLGWRSRKLSTMSYWNLVSINKNSFWNWVFWFNDMIPITILSWSGNVFLFLFFFYLNILC